MAIFNSYVSHNQRVTSPLVSKHGPHGIVHLETEDEDVAT